MFKVKFLAITSSLLVFCMSCVGMVVDNRYFPLFPKPYLRTQDKPSRFAVDVFFMMSDKSFSDNEDEVGLPEIWGKYNQGKLSQWMIAAGFTSPLLDEWRAFDIKWRMDGKLQAQGISLTYDQALTERFSIGGSCLFMRSNSWHDFLYEHDVSLRLNAADRVELDEIRRRMHQEIGLSEPCARQAGFGDVDLYVRYGWLCDYSYKFRRIDAGLKFGMLIPTGCVRDQDNPASIPFGGDGFWGVYGSAEGMFELKEDLVAGLSVRISKRFAKDRIMRMPLVISNEPSQKLENSALYGVVKVPVRFSPGATFMVSPYVAFENLRAGLGASARYTLIIHDYDDIEDRRAAGERDLRLPLQVLEKKTRWASDYISLTVFYDFGKVSVEEGMSPTVGLTWDIPVALLKSYNMSKTHKVTLGLELHF